MSQHVNTRYCECKVDCECYDVPKTHGGASVDVFSVSAITAKVDLNNPENPVSVDLNCEELKKAFMMSTAGADGTTFETFATDVQLLADEAASRAYPTVLDANSVLGEFDDARIFTIRICLKWKWLKIYIIWKF